MKLIAAAILFSSALMTASHWVRDGHSKYHIEQGWHLWKSLPYLFLMKDRLQNLNSFKWDRGIIFFPVKAVMLFFSNLKPRRHPWSFPKLYFSLKGYGPDEIGRCMNSWGKIFKQEFPIWRIFTNWCYETKLVSFEFTRPLCWSKF